MASQMCNKKKNKQKNTVFHLKELLSQKILFFEWKTEFFDIYHTSGADELCLLQENYAFQSKTQFIGR